MQRSGSTEPVRSLDVGLVGRDAQLAAVLEVLGAAGGDLANVVLIAGEPGVGKSSLARAVVATVPGRTDDVGC